MGEHPNGRRAIDIMTRDLIKSGTRPEKAREVARETARRAERKEREKRR